MMFYTTVCGWMVYYFYKMITGSFQNATANQITATFNHMLASPSINVGYMVLVVLLGFFVVSKGLVDGLEKVSKTMMICLLGLMVILAVRSVTLPGASAGLKYYLVPDFGKMKEYGIGNVIFAAMGQAFFTLSLGIGAIAIFGSFIDKDRRLTSEAMQVVALDTFVAIVAGLIVIPACFAYHVDPGQGPGLIFVSLPNIFANMAGGNIWGALFFLFMSFAAFTTIIAVFQNILTMTKELTGWNRTQNLLVSCLGVLILSLPCALGFNVWSFIQPLGAGTNIQSLEDFIVSNNLLPLGSMIYVLFCTAKNGWGWKHFLQEANSGEGIRFPKSIRWYCGIVIPLLILIIFVQGYIVYFAG